MSKYKSKLYKGVYLHKNIACVIINHIQLKQDFIYMNFYALQFTKRKSLYNQINRKSIKLYSDYTPCRIMIRNKFMQEATRGFIRSEGMAAAGFDLSTRKT